MTYDDWKLETPEDEHHRIHGAPKRGVYTVTVTRTVYQRLVVEVQAGSEEDARFDAVIEAKRLGDWQESDEPDYDVEDVEGPPERDPDDARDD